MDMNTKHKILREAEPGPPIPIPPDPRPDPSEPIPPFPEPEPPLPEPDEPDRSHPRIRAAWSSVSIVGGLVRMRRPTTS
jgi:hypothetical protein